ncbi:lysine-specific demethylase phf2-like [Cydia amplana]|uniref:lysine-specific demethylase phf2-like n=1 Tax=Cydia amplana TaxID=1869771 RepID=UPI002FE6C3DC
MASSKETYCLCGQPYNIGQFMIECDCCREWFHGSCVDVKIYQSDDIDKYHCPKCAQTYGPSVLKTPTNNHRADRYELGAETRPSQTGSPAWVRALAARPLRPAPPALARLQPRQFTEEFVRDNGFTRPILFTTSEGLEIETPNPATFSARSVLRFCGKNHEVEVIDVRRQTTLRMPLGDFVEYFETPPDLRGERVLNVLSLEFSDTNMAPLVEPPATIRRLDWASSVWPSAESPPRPAVQKYCLMSAAGSYTDFHVDFGGTAVWYHVMHGGKIFYLIPPTSTNLALYQQWSASNNQNERFFGDMVEWYGTAELCAGQTLCIPGGWIHAVLTPQDTLVFGGNLLHSYSIEMQLQIYEIERRVETPIMLRYPLFEAMHWYAGAHLLTMLRRHNEETQDEDFTLHEAGARAPAPLPALLLRGVRILATALKEWHALKSTDSAKRDNVPKCLNSGQLVRELCKELRTLEKRSASAANKDKDFKIKNHISPNKAIAKKQQAPKRSLKLTLPKPIMHMAQPDEFVEEKIYADKFYIENKEVVYDSRYPQGIKYANGLQDTKYIVETKDPLPEKYTFQHYEEPLYHDPAYDRQDKMKIRLNYASPPREEQPPPPYSLPEHSILKSHLVRTDRPALKPIHQWTISKKDLGYQEEQILFTNENLQANMRVEQDINYGPGMYSAEDIQQDYQYSEAAKPGSYQPEYGYPQAAYSRLEAPMQTVQQAASYAPMVPDMNGYHALPSYDAAIAQQYPANNYVIEEQKPAAPTPVRRSERPVRRRVSHTYDYEDGDLYIDDTPTPRRRKHRPKPYNQQSNSYRAPAVAPPRPANGIESLIQASVLAEEDPSDHTTEDAAVAVAGMLSISERYEAPPRTFGLASDEPDPPTESASARGNKRVRKPAPRVEDPMDDEDIIKEVHRDEEYVYPSLEMSSDEDEDWSSSRRRRNSRNRVDSRSKGDKDESWSPRARLGRLVPRLRGPARAGVRRECVRAALHAAAHQPAPQHQQQRREQNAKRAVLATKSRRPPPPVHNTPNNKNSRLKKGMKTAKQRLGKILKIHKMIY